MNFVPRPMTALMAIAITLGAPGCAASSRREPGPPASAQILTTRILVSTELPGATVELAAERLGWSHDLPERVRQAVRTLPSTNGDGPLYQLVGTTPYEVHLPVAISYDGRVFELYRWLRARVTAEGHPPFERNLGVVGIEGQGSYEIRLALGGAGLSGRPKSAVARR